MAGEHVLVIDDEPDLAELVAVNLELAGYRTSRAHDGQAGLDAIRRQRPDVVLLDVMMPVLDGWGVLAALQQDAETRELPVVMLTALSGERDEIRGHLAGALTYVTKPFDLQALLGAVGDALRPMDDQQRHQRATRLRAFVTRLAELEAGREGDASVRFSRLEPPPRPSTRPAPDPEVLEQLTSRQREIAALLGAGWTARRIAAHLGTTRSNVYATRKRVAQHLGVAPKEVGEQALKLGLEPDHA